ncbi:MAG: hypothetical protein IJZ35_03555 [Clostridia bacterium]|nr:hypothetical protein [Clostridia bacterium]
MKKVFSAILIITVISLFFLCSCDNAKNDEEQSTDFNEEMIAVIEKSPALTSGNLITKTDTDDDGNIIVTYYDNKDNPVEEYVWNGDEKISHNVMQYTESGLISTREEISPDGKSNTVYFYSYSDNGVLTGTTISTYENSLLIKTSTYDANENITEYILNSYNDKNLVVKAQRYNGDDNLLEYSVYDYNENSQLKKFSTFTADDELEKYTTFEYNSEGQKISEKYFDGNNVLQSRYVTEYYDSGETKSITVYDGNGNIVSSETFQQQ